MRIRLPLALMSFVLFGPQIDAAPTPQEAPAPPVAGAAGPRQAFVLDEKDRAVARVDLASGQILGRLALGEPDPSVLLRSPDGRRLIVIHSLRGKWTLRFGFHPEAPTAATIIDAASLQIVKRLDLGWGWPDLITVRKVMGYGLDLGTRGPVFSPDGRRLLVVFPGYVTNKPAETRPRELFIIDLQGGEVTARVALEPPVRGWTPFGVTTRARLGVETACRPVLTRDGAIAIVLTERTLGDDKKVEPARLHFVDVAAGAVVSSPALDGAPARMALSPDEKYLYVIDPGDPVDEKQPRGEGKILAVNVATRTIEKILPTGIDPTGPLADRAGRMLVASGEAGGRGEGRLVALREAAVVAEVPVVSRPRFMLLASDGDTLAIASANALMTLKAADLSVLQTTTWGAAPGASSGPSPADEAPVTDLLLSPDGGRAALMLEGTSKLTLLDLRAGKRVAEARIGLSGGQKFALGLVGGILAGANAAMGRMAEARTGVSWPMYNSDPNMFLPTFSATFLTMGRDGRYVYAYSTEAGTLSAIDMETGAVAGRFGAAFSAEYPMFEVPRAGALVVVGLQSVSIIDTRGRKVRRVVKHDTVRDLAVSPDGALAVASGDDLVYLDLEADEARRIEGFKRPTAVVFDPVRGAPGND